ncbi:MAG: glutamine-hydrolyzing carbamoyl-phosphate synthase small subunit [Deltaproteobacteria bacterium]|nr:glutamine-hydrolyzing carbamoyl-phosphate synthase small subunit [Deltaproteobacteria bacterium]
MEMQKALLALEDGRCFNCASFTGGGEAGGEVVFNTGMTGYQEVLTDPSYQGQMVCMTYPLVGSYGTNPEDLESDRIQVAAFLIREYQEHPNNFRSTAALRDYLISGNVLGICGFDTRALVRHIREKGAMRGMISTKDLNPASLTKRVVSEVPSMAGLDLAGGVSTDRPYRLVNDEKEFVGASDLNPSVWRTTDGRPRVTAFDFGIKYNIARSLEAAGCEVVIVPARFGAEKAMSLKPSGVFLSNGPGDPEPLDYAIDTARALAGKVPMFGICLGHQILGLALGAKTYKLKFGHRGLNQPVKNLLNGRIEITSQNHGFAVDQKSLPADVELTHVNLNDDTCEGFRHKSLPLFAAQYHPEAAPGPHDAQYLFDDFVNMMKNR